MLTVRFQREAMARLGLTVATVQEVVAVAFGGRTVGEVYEGDRRFDIVVRLPEKARTNIEVMGRLPIPLPPGSTAAFVPLDAVADIEIAPGPNQVSRENGKWRVVVGGVLSSTFLTLLILPVLYRLFARHEPELPS